MKRKIEVPSQISKVSTLAGGGMSLVVHTQDMTDAEKVTLMSFQNKAGYFLFSENEFSEDDVPKQDAQYEGKTPSQRLRDVLFVYYKQIGSTEDFETYYRSQIEKIIFKVKEKLV